MSKKKEAAPMLVDGKHSSESTFEALLNAEEEHFLIEVYDDRYKPMGNAVTKVVQKYESNKDGAFIKLQYLGCSDGHYKWYIEQEGKPGGLPRDALHHLCRDDPDKCKVKASGRAVLHVRKWAPVGRTMAHECLVSWGYPGLPKEPSSPPGDRSRSPRPRTTGRSKRESGGAREKKDPPATASKAKARSRQTDRHDNVDWGDDDDPEEVEEEDSREEPPARRPALKDEKAGVRNFTGGASALDKMLDREGDSLHDKALEDKLTHLRGKLAASGGLPGNTGRKPGGILAKRAADAAGEEKQRKKKRSRRKSGKAVLSDLRRAISSKKRKSESSHSDEGSYSEDEDIGDSAGAYETRRKKFKKIAENTPGKLMAQSLEDMEEHLGTKFGDARGPEDRLNPVVTRYLLSVINPALGSKMSKSAMRELRTIALATDHLLRGRSDSCGDVLLQRFKSLCMQARDGSEKFGPQIELLPDDLLEAGGSFGEDQFAKEMAYKEARNKALMGKTLGGPRGSSI